MANFNLANRIEIVNPAANVDATYGPYADVAEANAAIIEGLRVQGRTVGILSGGTVVEYWWKDGVTDLDLVEKTSGGGGSALTVRDDTTSVEEVSQITFVGAVVSEDAPGLTTVTISSPDTSGLVPYTGATTNVNLGEFQLSTGQVTFDQTPTQAAGVGVLRWNDTDGTLDLGLKGGNVTLQIGQEQFIRVKADEVIRNGQAVYATGAVGATGRITVAKFIADNTIDELYFIGIATEDIAANQEGFITTFGTVRGLNLTNGGNIYEETGYTDGTILYASPTTSGYLTKTKPEAPNLSIPVAIVLHADANGQVQVRPTTGFHLNELHDVLITDITNREILQWNATDSYWQNVTLAEAGIQPAGSYATAAQGALADSSVQPGDNISDLSNDENYITSDVIGVAGADLVTNIISLTQAEYDAIATPDASTIYNITDAPPPTGLQAVVDDTAPVLGGNLNANNFEVSNLSRINGTTTSTIISGAASGATALQNVVQDLTPQLGGALDTQGNAITGNYSTDGYRGIITETTTTRSTSLTDAGDFILFDNATSSEYRILDDAAVLFPDGTEIDLLQKGVGVLTIVAVSGVRLNGVTAGSTTVTAQWGGATIKKILANQWIIVGKINDVA